MSDVKTDFQRKMFLDALAEQARSLTQPQGQQEFTGQRCDLCECKPAKHWCKDCEQSICDDCKRIHLKSKLSRTHAVPSLKSVRKRFQVESEGQLNHKIKQYTLAIKQYQTSMATKQTQEQTVLASIEESEQRTIQKVTAFYKSLRSQVTNTLQQSRHDGQLKRQALSDVVTSMHAKLQELNSPITTDFVNEQLVMAKYLQTIREPNIDMISHAVKLKINGKWTPTNLATLDITNMYRYP